MSDIPENAEDLFSRFSIVETYNLHASPQITKEVEVQTAKVLTLNMSREDVESALKDLEERKKSDEPVETAIVNDKPPSTPSLTESIFNINPAQAEINFNNWMFN